MQKYYVYISLIVLCAAAFVKSFAGDLHKEVRRTNEKEVRVKLETSFGTLKLSKGNAEHIVVVNYRPEKNKESDIDLEYRVQHETGNLNLELNPKGSRNSHDGSVHVNFDIQSDQWNVQLNNELPLMIDAELGAGRGDFDFTGMNITKLSISTGATSTKVRFDEPNKGVIENFRITSGVSKFVGDKLNNANFKRFEFEGGVGSYYLNFEGALQREVDVHIEIGLGAITIVIPKDVGARIKYAEGWLSNFSIDDDEFDEQRKGVYTTSNYSSATGKMNITIDSGLGSIKIRRTK